MCSKPSCLGEPWCSVWGCCESDSDVDNFKEPPRKKLKKAVNADCHSSRRFSAPTSPSKMEKICKGFTPKNTQKATDWACRVFQERRAERTKSAKGKCPLTLLENPRADALNYWLSRFVVEVRREDGRPSSVSNLLAGLYRYSKERIRTCPTFMNRKDPSFRELTGAIQVRYRELREEGVGAVVKHAPVVVPDEEDRLWQSKVIGDHNPLALQSVSLCNRSSRYRVSSYVYRGKSHLQLQRRRMLQLLQCLPSSNPLLQLAMYLALFFQALATAASTFPHKTSL